MEQCSTVSEALDILEKYSLGGFEQAQMMIVDKTGDAAIIEGDVIHRKSGPWMVSTNFTLSQVKKGEKPPCERYLIATKMLSEMDVSIEAFRKILKSTHFEGAWGGTQYSNVFIPEDGIIHLYHFHNYEDSVILNINDELKRGERSVKIADLFPDNFTYRSYLESIPDNDSNLIIQVLREKGAEAALDLADKIGEALKKINPLVKESFNFEPVTIVQKERNWSFAMVAGKHWKIRTFIGGSKALNQAAAKLAAQNELNEAIQLIKQAVERYQKKPALLYTMTNLYIQSGDLDSASKSYQKLIEIAPKDNYWVKDLFSKIQKMRERDQIH
jgi:tetratricopeptide (TPR) repeat protein